MEPLYVVLIILIFIWTGIFVYMRHLDKQVRDLNEKFKKLEKSGVN
jgi:CcmD family protein